MSGTFFCERLSYFFSVTLAHHRIQRRNGSAILILVFKVERQHVPSAMGLAVVAVTVTKPGPALRASALAVGMLALTESGVVAGVVAVVLL